MSPELSRAAGNISREFRWRTQDGLSLTLTEMHDRHIVYSMRMIYNNFLTEYGLDPVPGGLRWDLSRRPAESWLRSLTAFMWEIENNRSLSGKLQELYGAMKLRILEACGIEVQWLRELQEKKCIPLQIEDQEVKMTDYIALSQELATALAKAEAHLSYCGYGDSWEREGAMAQKLPETIERALQSARSAGLEVNGG